MFNFFKKKENKGNVDYQNEVEVAPVIEMVKKQWRPVEKYDYYWFITDGHGCFEESWDGDGTDRARMKAGNMFRTRTEARRMRDRVKKLFGKL